MNQFECKNYLEGIQIHPELPGLMKKFIKDAIRTNPKDLELWAGNYFQALKNNEPLPVKDSIEFDPKTAESGLTPGLLRVLHKQLKIKPQWPLKEIQKKWAGIGLDPCHLKLCIQNFQSQNQNEMKKCLENVPWKYVMAILAQTLSCDGNLSETMKLICEIMSEKEAGMGQPFVCYEKWWELYLFLAMASNDPNVQNEQIVRVGEYLSGIVALRDKWEISPVDFENVDCPSLN